MTQIVTPADILQAILDDPENHTFVGAWGEPAQLTSHFVDSVAHTNLFMHLKFNIADVNELIAPFMAWNERLVASLRHYRISLIGTWNGVTVNHPRLLPENEPIRPVAMWLFARYWDSAIDHRLDSHKDLESIDQLVRQMRDSWWSRQAAMFLSTGVLADYSETRYVLERTFNSRRVRLILSEIEDTGRWYISGMEVEVRLGYLQETHPPADLRPDLIEKLLGRCMKLLGGAGHTSQM